MCRKRKREEFLQQEQSQAETLHQTNSQVINPQIVSLQEEQGDNPRLSNSSSASNFKMPLRKKRKF